MIFSFNNLNRLFLSILILLLTACGSGSPKLGEYNFGQPVNITTDKINKLIKGQTTYQEAINMFGRPKSERISGQRLIGEWKESNIQATCALCSAVFDNKEMTLTFDVTTKIYQTIDYQIQPADSKRNDLFMSY